MANRKFPNPSKEIPTWIIEEYCTLVKYGELKVSLEYLENIEDENKDLKENIKEANECIRKLREKNKNFRERNKEFSEQLKQENEYIIDLKVKVEEKKRIEEYIWMQWWKANKRNVQGLKKK